MKRILISIGLIFMGVMVGSISVFQIIVPTIQTEIEQVIIQEKLSAFNGLRARFLSEYRKQPDKVGVGSIIDEICLELHILGNDASKFTGNEIKRMNVNEYAPFVLTGYISLADELTLETTCSEVKGL